jgi:hypothetical protein
VASLFVGDVLRLLFEMTGILGLFEDRVNGVSPFKLGLL